jgi:phosphoribosylanthranilate isomerase
MSIKVKICGLTNLEDARLALACGADELGFVLAPSPRRVEPEAVRAIVEALKGEGRFVGFRAIGVFVNEEPDAMRGILSYASLDAAQVHGDETPETCSAFDFPWYRALRIASVAEALELAGAGWRCPRILVDASGSAYGGTGSSIGTWAALAARAVARDSGREYFVAGGVRPRNAASFVYSLSPDGIDVSSGVEEAPGRKSPEKLEALFRAIRAAEGAGAEGMRAEGGGDAGQQAEEPRRAAG